MEIIGLTRENVGEYTDYLTEDTAEWIGREFICAFLVCRDDRKPAAGIVWELRNGEGESETGIDSRIRWIRADDKEAADYLLESYTEIAEEMECGHTYFRLPAPLGDIEKKAFEKAGFSLAEKEGDVISVTLEELEAMHLMKSKEVNENIKPLCEADDRDLDIAIARLDMEGKRGVCEDLPYLPRDHFENDISSYSEDDGEINGLILLHRFPSGKLIVDLLTGWGDDASQIMVQMMRQTVISASQKYPKDTVFIIDRHNESSQMLTGRLFPKDVGIAVVEGSRKEEMPEADHEEENPVGEDDWLFDLG